MAAIAIIWFTASASFAAAIEPIAVTSPDGHIVIELHSIASANGESPAYRVSYRGNVVIADSALGMTIVQGGALRGLQIVETKRDQHDDTYPFIAGKSASARDHYREAVVTLQESKDGGAVGRRIEIAMRAYDDGVAFRYRIPQQPAISNFEITSEDTTFAPPADATAWVLPVSSFTTPYEFHYQQKKVADIEPRQLIGLPLLLELPNDGPAVAITEADLTDYAGMYLVRHNDGPANILHAALSPLPGQKEIKVKGRAPHNSPWRVIMIAADAAKLIESNLVLNLSPPCALKDTSWIKPGKVAFLWWNGYLVGDNGKRGGVNTATFKHYIDGAAEFHFAYSSIDGLDIAWYGGKIPGHGENDITVPVKDLDMPAVLAYAKSKGVRIRLWVASAGLRKYLDKALDTYEQWGVEGIMVDFIDRDDQEIVNWVNEMVAKAAQHHLTVTLHNVWKPTGLRRTYPNLLTREAVLNQEYNKWSRVGSTPEHQLTVPFTRMLAGPLDFHMGGFRSVRQVDFLPRDVAPDVMGSRCQQLAMYVVYEDPMPMAVDYPAAYRGRPGIDFLSMVPTTWDETRAIQGKVGEFITLARRKGADWYVGTMSATAARDLDIPLRFLASGKFTAQMWSDDPSGDLNQVKSETRIVSAADTITAHLIEAGGQVVKLSPTTTP